MKKVMGLIAGLVLACSASATDLTTADMLPSSRPLTVTLVSTCQGSEMVPAVALISYPDGKVVRFFNGHMYGFDLPGLLKYASLALDEYNVGPETCKQ